MTEMLEPEVDVQPSAEALAVAVAGRLAALLGEAQAAGRTPAIVLTGGTVAVKIHEAVLAATRGDRVDWRAVDVWWGDERYVAADDPERNARQAHEALLAHVDVSQERVHEMPASDGGHGSVEEAAAAYDEEVRSRGDEPFDVVMLGVGPDGHVASLFPGHPALDVDDADVVPVRESPKPPPERISLTFPALNRAREVWFVVAGEGKAEAVQRALGRRVDEAAVGPDVHEIPAVGVRGRERTVWFLDEGSASRLPPR